MKTLTEFKREMRAYYNENVHTGESWEDYWDMLYDALAAKHAIVYKNDIKYVKDKEDIL